MSVRIRSTLATIFFVLLLSLLNAGGGGASARSPKVLGGLPHSDINDIVQDSHGYMWMATYGGLCKWDGYRLTVITPENSGISKERVLCLCAASDSLLYVGTEVGGINIYDDRTMEFFQVRYDSSVNDDVVNHIFEGPGRTVYVCHNNLISRIDWDGSTAVLKTVFKFPGKGAVICGVGMEDGNMLIGYGYLLYRITQEGELLGTIGDMSERSGWSSLERLPNGDILATSYGGIFIIDGRTFEVRKISGVPSHTAIMDNYGTIWAGTLNSGLHRLDPDTGEVMEHFGDNTVGKPGITSAEVNTLFEDSSGVLWIGTISGGLNTLDLCDNNIRKYTTEEGLSHNRTLTFGEDRSHRRLWITSRDASIDIMDLESRTIHPLTIRSQAESFRAVSAFFDGGEKDILIGTWNHGLWSIPYSDVENMERNGWTVRAFPFDDPLVRTRSVFKIVKDGDGHFWISTDGGVLEYLPAERVFREYRYDSANYNSLSSDFVTDICTKGSGDGKTVWVGTRSGLNLIEYGESEGGRWHRIRLDRALDGESQFISGLLFDRNGDLWATTLGEGLYKLDAASVESGQYIFNRQQPDGGFASNELESILEDDNGRLWIGGYGISCYDPATGSVKTYTEKDNLQSNSFKIWAALKLSNGDMAFGGTDGANVFSPYDIRTNDCVRETRLSSFKVRGESRNVSGTVVLRHNENEFTAEFSSLVYNNPEYNVYRYRLEGLEKDWTIVSGHDPKAVYSNLPAGKFHFVVYGSNSDGVWSDKPASVHIKVRPKPLSSPLAIVLYVLLAVAGFILSVRAYQKRAEENNRRKVEQDKLRFFTYLAHEIKTPLTLIAAPVEELLENPSLGQSTRRKLQIVDRSTNSLRSLMEQILDLQKYEDNMMKLTVAEIDICTFLTETAALFTPLAAARRINFRTDICDGPQMVYLDRGKMERVVINLLSNAFKFTPDGGSVVLGCTADSQSASFWVEDNGTGIPEGDLDKIFGRFYQVDNQTRNSEGGTGIGLSLSKYIVEHHHGEIKVESRLNFGSKFTVRLLKGTAHLGDARIDEGYVESDDLSGYDPLEGFRMEEMAESGKDSTILVVDDNDKLRDYLVSMLKTRYNVISAGNGMRAYEMAIAEQPDLILSDVVMPGMSGMELCQKIKGNEATCHIPVILLTARNLVSTEVESWQVGADGFITKPFHIEVLLSRINNLISARERLRKMFRSTVEVNPSEITIVSSDEKLMMKCLEEIEARMDDPDFGVDALCKGVGVSRAQLYRKISNITGLSTVQFIRSIRLKRAAQMLSQDGSSISDVMYKVGFNNASYFSKLFKEEFGCLPKEYSKK